MVKWMKVQRHLRHDFRHEALLGLREPQAFFLIWQPQQPEMEPPRIINNLPKNIHITFIKNYYY